MTYSEVQLKIVAENARSMLNSLAGVPETVSLREDFLKQRDIMIAAAAEAQYSAMVLGATGTWADRLEEEVAPHAQGVAVALAAPSCRQWPACQLPLSPYVRKMRTQRASMAHGPASATGPCAHICRSLKPIFKMTTLVPATRGMGLRGQCRGPRRPVHLVSLLIWYPELKEVMLRRSAAWSG